MKQTFTLLISILATTTVACGSRQQPAKLSALEDANTELFTSIGKGAKLTLLKDINISPNLHQVDIGPFEDLVLVNRDTNVYRKTWRYCGLMLKEISLDRRVLKSGSAIELSGEALNYAVGENNEHKIEGVGVATPVAIDHIGCAKFESTCEENPFRDNLLCSRRKQTPFNMSDLQFVMKDVALIERADPVVIPTR